MIAYFCKYVPVELLEACGAHLTCIEPHVSSFTQADALMHPNVCSFAKAVLEEFEQRPLDGMIFTTCCDSSRRLYDVLKNRFPDKFFFCLDLPRKINDFAVSLYERQLRKLLQAYADFSGNPIPEDSILMKKIAAAVETGAKDKGTVTMQFSTSQDPDAAFNSASEWTKTASVSVSGPPGAGRDSSSKWEELASVPVSELPGVVRDSSAKQADTTPVSVSDTSEEISCSGNSKLRLALAGARPGSDIRTLIWQLGAEIVLDLSCTGISRSYANLHTLNDYAHALLDQIPCMRMASASNRQRILEAYEDRIDGIVYHTIKFCDIYSYEYVRLHETGGFPLLKIETDATEQCAGQILTRLEAFLESLAAKKGGSMHSTDVKTNKPVQSANETNTPQAPDAFKKRYVLGIDSGSTSTNAVILDENRNILASAVVRTGAKSSESAQRILDEVLTKADLPRSSISAIISTGYGRVSIPFADENVTEISCHGKGAHFLNPRIRTILDIGGQDSKAIRLNEKGDVIDFVMNDKCAAGTGRFLEMMARTLEVDLSELGPLSMNSREDIKISSMCSVFAESEVISLIAQNKEPADIAHGIHMAIASKALSLLRRVGLEADFMMTGGVAKNPGVVQVLEQELRAPLFIYEEPEIVGALGAALYGLERYTHTATP